jgi:hypothetical protein
MDEWRERERREKERLENEGRESGMCKGKGEGGCVEGIVEFEVCVQGRLEGFVKREG